MAMRIALVIALVAVVLPGGADARSVGRCDLPTHAQVLAKSRAAVVFRHRSTFTACLKRTGAKQKLRAGALLDGSVPAHFRLRGTKLAYEYDHGCFGPCWRIASVDVGGSRAWRSYPANGTLRRLVIDARGRVAWVRDDVVGRELRAMDEDGEELLAQGSDIGPASVALAPDRVTWTNRAGTSSAVWPADPSCGLPSSATLIRTETARVYWSAGHVWGCVAATGRRTDVGPRDIEDMEYFGGFYVYAAGNFATIDEGYVAAEAAARTSACSTCSRAGRSTAGPVATGSTTPGCCPAGSRPPARPSGRTRATRAAARWRSGNPTRMARRSFSTRRRSQSSIGSRSRCRARRPRGSTETKSAPPTCARARRSAATTCSGHARSLCSPGSAAARPRM